MTSPCVADSTSPNEPRTCSIPIKSSVPAKHRNKRDLHGAAEAMTKLRVRSFLPVIAFEMDGYGTLSWNPHGTLDAAFVIRGSFASLVSFFVFFGEFIHIWLRGID